MKKLSDEERERRGRQAQAVLENELVREAIDGMRARAIERWRGHANVAEREEEWRFVRTVDEFERLLDVAIRAGQEVARMTEERARSRARMSRRFGLA